MVMNVPEEHELLMQKSPLYAAEYRRSRDMPLGFPHLRSIQNAREVLKSNLLRLFIADGN